MIYKTDEHQIFNTENCIRKRNHTRVTEEFPCPRVRLVKTELPCTQRHNRDAWFNYVTVEKYIDGVLVKTYHWIQDIDQEELQEFLKIDIQVQREHLPKNPDDPRIPYFREYYKLHREQIIERQKENRRAAYDKAYYERNKEKRLQQCKAYQESHREQINQRKRQNYKLKKIKELCQDLQKDNSSEECS